MIPTTWELHMAGVYRGKLVPLCLLASHGLVDTGTDGRVGDMRCIACRSYAIVEEYDDDDRDARYFMPGN